MRNSHMADARLPRYMFSLQGEERCPMGCNMPMVYSRSHAENGVAVEVTVAVLADYANVSQDGKLNIMGIFQEINATAFPFPLPRMFLVLTFEAGPAEFGSQKQLRIALLDEDGAEKITMSGELQVPRPPRPGRQAYINEAIGLAGVPFEKAGDYQFAILVGGETKETVLLHVNDLSKGGTK
jgi:hypothetical protein